MPINFPNIRRGVKILTTNKVLIALLCCTSCKKLVDIDPPITAITSENVYSTDATAIGVLTGIYAQLSNNEFRFTTGGNSVSVLTGLSSDELTLAEGSNNSNSTFVSFYLNKLTNTIDDPWRGIYSCLYTINTALENLEKANSLTPSIRNQLIGEAKFIRAFCYFYLTNLYGDVPLVLTTNYKLNTNIAKSNQSLVYDQIVFDLKDAQELLSETYLNSTLLTTTSERVRPTKWAATALLARAYLFKGDWANAETQATSTINNSLFSLSTLDKSFIKASSGNKEAIWQLQPVNSGSNTEDAKIFILNAQPGNNKPVYLDTLLVKSFEAGDVRRTNWTRDTVFSGMKYTYPTKYKIAIDNQPVDEYLMVLRLAEQYLIRAEARAQQNNLGSAISDLDMLRQRAMLPLIATTNPGISKAALLAAILHERQIELFTEWGHRWLDLKRTNQVDAVMSIITPLKGGAWSPSWALYPIPFRDLQYNPKITQNTGY